MSPFTPEQEEEASELFRQGRTTAEVFRHFGATSIGQQSPIEQENAAVESIPNTPSFANKFTDLIGMKGATDVFGSAIARTEIGAKMTGTDVNANREFIEAPTGKQIGGAALQTLATAASPAIAPIGLAAGVATGAALGYSYDVGNDLIAGANIKDTLTPGGATAVGAIAPPVLKGAMGLLKKPVEAIGRGLSNAVGDASMPTMPDLNMPPVVSETVSDIGSRIKKVTGNVTGFVKDKVAVAERVKSAPPNVQPAIRAEVDDVIIDLAQNSDDATKTAMREMVNIAETPKTARPTAGAARVASDTAVDQYNVILSKKKNIGTQIGELSDTLPTLKTIDVTAQQNTIVEVFKQNGITLGADGKFVATDNFKVSDEQLNVLNKIFDKVTTSNNLSAKNIHQLDQWFSSTQRTARMVDKIEDMFIKVPTADGQIDVPIYKFFRDTFGQRLDEVAPDNLRSLNQQYRQLSNLTEDIEGTLVKNSNLKTLQSTDISNPSTLRRMFGEAQSAEEFSLIYNNMDTTSRQFGYDGARADELYYFANKIRDYYPDEIPDTGIRANIGSSIMDMVGGVLNAGKVDAADQREALKVLLEMTT